MTHGTIMKIDPACLRCGESIPVCVFVQYNRNGNGTGFSWLAFRGAQYRKVEVATAQLQGYSAHIKSFSIEAGDSRKALGNRKPDMVPRSRASSLSGRILA